jgi:hypothetical protein
MNEYNDKQEPNGYWEVYYDNDELYYNGVYNNGSRVGYWHVNIKYALTSSDEYKIYYL